MKAELRNSPKGLRAIDLKLRGIKIYEVDHTSKGLLEYSRRDFYKICLYQGQRLIHYADKTLSFDGYSLFFGTPHIPYSWDAQSAQFNSYTCIFTEEFIHHSERLKSLQESKSKTHRTLPTG
jgi:AraC family transcriptional activator of pobA